MGSEDKCPSKIQTGHRRLLVRNWKLTALLPTPSIALRVKLIGRQLSRNEFILIFCDKTRLGNFPHCWIDASVVTVLEHLGTTQSPFWSSDILCFLAVQPLLSPIYSLPTAVSGRTILLHSRNLVSHTLMLHISVIWGDTKPLIVTW